MPTAAAAIAHARRAAGTLNSSRSSATPISTKAAVHIEFSRTLPRKFVEITAYHEQHSASTISGTIGWRCSWSCRNG